jgi:hypothetical protein
MLADNVSRRSVLIWEAGCLLYPKREMVHGIQRALCPQCNGRRRRNFFLRALDAKKTLRTDKGRVTKLFSGRNFKKFKET